MRRKRSKKPIIINNKCNKLKQKRLNDQQKQKLKEIGDFLNLISPEEDYFSKIAVHSNIDKINIDPVKALQEASTNELYAILCCLRYIKKNDINMYNEVVTEVTKYIIDKDFSQQVESPFIEYFLPQEELKSPIAMYYGVILLLYRNNQGIFNKLFKQYIEKIFHIDFNHNLSIISSISLESILSIFDNDIKNKILLHCVQKTVPQKKKNIHTTIFEVFSKPYNIVRERTIYSESLKIPIILTELIKSEFAVNIANEVVINLTCAYVELYQEIYNSTCYELYKTLVLERIEKLLINLIYRDYKEVFNLITQQQYIPDNLLRYLVYYTRNKTISSEHLLHIKQELKELINRFNDEEKQILLYHLGDRHSLPENTNPLLLKNDLYKAITYEAMVLNPTVSLEKKKSLTEDILPHILTYSQINNFIIQLLYHSQHELVYYTLEELEKINALNKLLEPNVLIFLQRYSKEELYLPQNLNIEESINVLTSYSIKLLDDQVTDAPQENYTEENNQDLSLIDEQQYDNQSPNIEYIVTSIYLTERNITYLNNFINITPSNSYHYMRIALAASVLGNIDLFKENYEKLIEEDKNIILSILGYNIYMGSTLFINSNKRLATILDYLYKFDIQKLCPEVVLQKGKGWLIDGISYLPENENVFHIGVIFNEMNLYCFIKVDVIEKLSQWDIVEKKLKEGQTPYDSIYKIICNIFELRPNTDERGLGYMYINQKEIIAIVDTYVNKHVNITETINNMQKKSMIPVPFATTI